MSYSFLDTGQLIFGMVYSIELKITLGLCEDQNERFILCV